MNEKFKNKYRISSARLQTWDYGNDGAYFITICTKYKEHFFGEIVMGESEQEMNLNDIGKIADKYWEEIASHFPIIELGKYVVMPNHVHGILIINNPEKILTSNSDFNDGKTFGQRRYQNQGKDTISSIVGSYKSAVTNEIHKFFPDFAWQPRFHDHIIRNAESFERIQNYIENNPRNWKEDKFFTK
ncbi:MAG TPA: transposase [Ignavibacteria bacterium]|nr:transposase [Ignavibacteria bacterium]